MTSTEWNHLLTNLSTRSQVRNALATELARLTAPGSGGVWVVEEIGPLRTGSDREVMQSFLMIKSRAGAGNAARRRTQAEAISESIHELFLLAIDRMKQLPTETLTIEPWATVRQVRRQ